jgi:ADP-dependent NAD(P)H-hydrate dehydratase
MSASAPVDRTSAATVLDETTMRAWPLPLHRDGDKHARGTVLVVGGSPGTAGAVVLAGLGALRIGAGRLQLAVAEPALLAATIAVPEALVTSLPVHDDGRLRPRRAASAIERFASAADAVLIGPGLVGDAATHRFVREVVPMVAADAILIVDAAAVTDARGAAMEDLVEVVAPVRDRLVVVANRDELGRLAQLAGGASGGAVDPGDPAVSDVAATLGAVVSSFGTVATADGRSWTSNAGTAGLGTSGSGDVLSGLAAGAAARCGDPAQAACWATFVHAAIGERLSRTSATVGYLAREIAAEAPAVLRDLERATWA